jgi:heparan-alpha-glucosaminide N-acetyltransferase
MNKPRLKNLFPGLKILGVVGLISLAAIFKAGSAEHVSWLVMGWWGILGLIGWGYLVAAVTGLLVGSNLIAAVGVWVFFISMNILSESGMLGFLNFLSPVFGVIIHGNVPSIVLAGFVISQVLNLSHLSIEKRSLIIAGAGITSLAVGFFLQNWFIISKIRGTQSWGLICGGISMLVFASLFMIIDRHGKYRWAVLFKPAGQNSLTTYLAPDVIYFTAWDLDGHCFSTNWKRVSCLLLADQSAGRWQWSVLLPCFRKYIFA